MTPSDKITPFTERRSVLQDWVSTLTFMQQTVLLTAIRGPDGVHKDHPVKTLLRWYRRCVLISAFNRTTLADPYIPGGGSFTGPCPQNEAGPIRSMEHAVELYFKAQDELPHHFIMHLTHAAEILGFKHPVPHIRLFWRTLYLTAVKKLHMHPETEEEMDKRLGDHEDAWKAREHGE